MKINKGRHRRDVLAVFSPGRWSSRVEISRATGLSPATVSRITRELVRREVLVEISQPTRTPGRPSQGLRLNGASGTVLGVSLLYPRLRVVVLDLEGRILGRSSAPLSSAHGRSGILRPLEQAVRGALRTSRRRPPLAAIGAALPGQWDPQAGVSLLFPRIPDWKDVPLRALLSDWTGAPATLIGHAPALALAEQSRRAGTEPRNLVTVEVAENIAMGAILNGSLLEGASGNAGELGHIAIESEGEICYCGARGCLEMKATCTAVLQQLRMTSYDEVVRRGSLGDPASTRALGRAARALGRGVATALSLFNPEVLVLNGRFFDAGDLVLGPLRAALREFAIPSSLKSLTLQQSVVGPDAAALGAGLAAVRGAVQLL